MLIGHESFGAGGKRIFGLIPHFMKLMLLSLFMKQLPEPSFDMPSKEAAITELRELHEAGKLTPIIDRSYPLRQTGEAFRHLIEGEPAGRIVVTP